MASPGTKVAPAKALTGPIRELKVETPLIYASLYNPPLGSLRYRTYYGGRGAARSWSIARALLVHGMQRPLRILCAREWQNSLEDSVLRVLGDQIDLLGLGGVYDVEAKYIGSASTEFLFKGLRKDINAIKSTEGVDICWVEEGQSVSKQSWRKLTPTIRKPGSEIWTSFNTENEDDPTYEKLVAPTIKEHKLYDPKFNGIAIKTSFKDNPWLPDVLREEEQQMLRTDPDEHAHVWLGDFWKRNKSRVLDGKWIVKEFEPDATWGDPYFGADFGFANDPAILSKVWIKDSRLYIEYAEGGVELDEGPLAAMYDRVPGSRDYLIRGDNSRPETISAMRNRGFKIEGAPKWAGSVEDGISHLRSYDAIIIHPRCPRAIQNAKAWRYKTRAGASGDPNAADAEILPKLVDGNEDVFDSIRYGISHLIKRNRGRFIFTN